MKSKLPIMAANFFTSSLLLTILSTYNFQKWAMSSFAFSSLYMPLSWSTMPLFPAFTCLKPNHPSGFNMGIIGSLGMSLLLYTPTVPCHSIFHTVWKVSWEQEPGTPLYFQHFAGYESPIHNMCSVQLLINYDLNQLHWWGNSSSRVNSANFPFLSSWLKHTVNESIILYLNCYCLQVGKKCPIPLCWPWLQSPQIGSFGHQVRKEVY